MRPKNQNKVWIGLTIIAVLIIVPVGMYLFSVFYSPPLPSAGTWEKTASDGLPVKVIAMQPADHPEVWSAINVADVLPEYQVLSGGHWLMSSPQPDNSDSLWYDGHLISTGGSDEYYMLSPNGQHYAYTHTPAAINDDSSLHTLRIDDKVVTEGNGIRPRHVADNGDVYYTCTHCNGRDEKAFYKNTTLLLTLNNSNNKVFDNLADSQCLYSSKQDVATLVETQVKQYANKEYAVFCSPSGNHFYFTTGQDLFPAGRLETLHIDNHVVDKGTFSNIVLGDNGKASYLRSNGRSGGNLVIAGKQYGLPAGQLLGGSNGNGGPLFSPSQLHSALVLGPTTTNGRGASTWWVDGRNTGYDHNLLVSIDDNALYVYKL